MPFSHAQQPRAQAVDAASRDGQPACPACSCPCFSVIGHAIAMQKHKPQKSTRSLPLIALVLVGRFTRLAVAFLQHNLPHHVLVKEVNHESTRRQAIVVRGQDAHHLVKQSCRLQPRHSADLESGQAVSHDAKGSVRAIKKATDFLPVQLGGGLV